MGKDLNDLVQEASADLSIFLCPHAPFPDGGQAIRFIPRFDARNLHLVILHPLLSHWMRWADGVRTMRYLPLMLQTLNDLTSLRLKVPLSVLPSRITLR